MRGRLTALRRPLDLIFFPAGPVLTAQEKILWKAGCFRWSDRQHQEPASQACKPNL